MVLWSKNVISGFRYVIYPSEVKWFCRMSNLGVQTGRVLASGAVFWPVTRVRAVVMSSTTWYQRRVDNIGLTIDYKKKSKMLSTAWYYEEKNVIYSFRYVIYPSEVKWYYRMSNFGVQTGRVLASGAVFWPVTRVRVRVRVRAVVMSSTTWYQRRVDNIVLTIDYKKSQRCYPPHGTMKKKCDVWLSLCYLPLTSQAILPNVKLRCPNASCFSFWGPLLALDLG